VPSVKSITLVNGLKVVHIPHDVGSVTACLRGLAGSNYEKHDEIGTAHALEHLCTFASKDYNTPKKLRNVILAKGGRVTGTVLKKSLPDAIEYLYQVFSQPILSNKNLEITKNIIKHEIYQNIEDPKKHIGRISYKMLYPDQRLAIYNTGKLEDLEKLTLKKVIGFRKRLYFPANFVLSVCGDFDNRLIFDLAEKYFGKICSVNLNHPLKLKPNYKAAFLIENRNNLAHLHLKIDYHGYKTGEKTKYPAYLLSTILKNRLKTTLYAISNQGPIAPYILDSSSFNSNSYGLFGTYTAIKSKELKDFLGIYKKVIDNLSKSGITQEDLNFAKNKAQADLEFALEKTSLRADFYSELYLYENLTNNHEDEINNYATCTKKDILEVAKDIFSLGPKITIIDKSLTASEVRNMYNQVFLKEKSYLHLKT